MNSGDRNHPLISFTPTGDGIRVQDELEGEDLYLWPDDETTLSQAPTDLFLFPVDNAITVTTQELRIDRHASVFLRDEMGEHLGEVSETPRELSRGTYYLELECAMKAYVRISEQSFTAALEPADGVAPTSITFPEPTRIAIGARSFHQHPQATITVPDDPEALMEAFSYLGSSLKEFSCERSWPSLRGHPPEIQRGDELDIPTYLRKPATGITITVPPNYADIYRIAPLAFYLGASLEPGDEPELHLANGYTEPLQTPARSLEETVDQVLGTCLLLDSLTRVGGYYSFPRYAYDELAPHLPFYPPNLYSESISDQLMEYLEVSAETIEPYLPEWPMTAVLRPQPDDAELVPYLLSSLARIRVADSPDEAGPTADLSPSLVTGYTHPDPPQGTARLVPESFRHALDHQIPLAEETQFTFVTNDSDRATRFRGLNDDVYGRYTIGSISVLEQPSRAQLQSALEAESHFLYCDLPITDGAFECRDGTLRVADLGTVGASMVAICADGLEPGVELATAGAMAGLVTDTPLTDEQIDALVYCLLSGHVFADCPRLAGIGTDAYRFVGDPTHSLIRLEGGVKPICLHIESVTPDEHTVSIRTQTSDTHQLGSVSRLVEEYAHNVYQLEGTTVDQPLGLSTETVVSLLDDEDVLVRLNGEVYVGDQEPTETFVHESARQSLTEKE